MNSFSNYWKNYVIYSYAPFSRITIGTISILWAYLECNYSFFHMTAPEILQNKVQKLPIPSSLFFKYVEGYKIISQSSMENNFWDLRQSEISQRSSRLIILSTYLYTYRYMYTGSFHIYIYMSVYMCMYL